MFRDPILDRVKREIRAEEPLSCWFDYIHLNPLQRSMAFADAYVESYRLFLSKRDDCRSAQFRDPLKRKRGENKQPIFESIPTKILNMLWKARQAADRLQMPYPHFVRLANEVADQWHWTFLPQPNHLYNEKMLLLIEDAWKKQTIHHVILPEATTHCHPGYFDYLKRIVHARHHPKYLLNQLIRKQYIDTSASFFHFGDQLTRDAISLHS